MNNQVESGRERTENIYPTIFTNKERFVLCLVDTLNFEAVLLFVWGITCQTTKYILQTLAVPWRSCETGSRQERKLVSDTKMSRSKVRNVDTVQR